MKKIIRKTLYYVNRAIFGIIAIFYILIGGRGCGKTYSTQNYCLRKFFKRGEKFLWLRLTEASVRNLLQNNAADFIDSKLIAKWKIESIRVEGNAVYLNGREACRIMAISTFYNEKGVAMNKTGVTIKKTTKIDTPESKAKITKTIKKFKTIVLDEMNREKAERRTFDICYSFVGQLENICRLDTNRRVILLGNTLDEASDIMAGLFNFIPEKVGYIYKLKKKRAVIHYIEDSDKYKEARKDSMAGILTPNESTFTNKIASDIELISKAPVGKPSYIIRFSNTQYFTVCGTVITKQKQPAHSKLPVIAMRPYLLGIPYYKEQAIKVIDMAQQRLYKFDKLITLKLFYKEIKVLKGE